MGRGAGGGYVLKWILTGVAHGVPAKGNEINVCARWTVPAAVTCGGKTRARWTGERKDTERKDNSPFSGGLGYR